MTPARTSPAPADPRTAAGWLAEPHALVVWDMQHCIAGRAVHLDRVTDVIAGLLAGARVAGIPIVHTRHVGLPSEQEDRVWRFARWHQGGRPEVLPDPPCPDGAPASAILTAVRPDAGEVVVDKHRPSIFAGTDVAAVLAAAGVDVILLTGVATDRGILATAREALLRGVLPVVVRDAVSAFTDEAHEQALAELEALTLVVDSRQVRDTWRARSGRG